MKKIITLIFLTAFITGCSVNNSKKIDVSNKAETTTTREMVNNQKEEIQEKDINDSTQIAIRKYSIDDVKRAFEGQNKGFIYYYDGFNNDTQRYMVSTDAAGHASSYHYEINLATGYIYDEKNQVIDRLDDMLKSITASQSLDSWVADYSFSEFVPPDQNMFYSISVFKENDSYYAEINIDGFQTTQRLKAEVEGDENSVKFIFSKYLEDNRFEPYKKGEILLSFEREKSDLNTFWGKITPIDKNNSESGGIYFESSNSLIPKGWHLAEAYGDSKVEGDLNADGIADLAFVIEENKIGESAPQRLLLIAIGNKDDESYTLKVTADNAILRADEGGVMGDPFMGLSIDRGSLLISHYGGSSWRWDNTYRFRYQNDGWYLIGATEDWFHTVSSADRKYEDINLITGDYIKIETDENGKEKKTEGNRGKKELVNLLDFDVNGERQF